MARHKKRYVKSRGLVEIRNKFKVFDDELEERPELEKKKKLEKNTENINGSCRGNTDRMTKNG